ncbi:hypothetical protein GGR56DRAFT_669065 [Xylariaceae sp. FL0804]|nr:hypothetical protein GGR56DRAFT_669065 [Xylariaceae sp. FL0804]
MLTRADGYFGGESQGARRARPHRLTYLAGYEVEAAAFRPGERGGDPGEAGRFAKQEARQYTMQLLGALLLSAAGGALAAKSTYAATEWTLTSVERTCTADDSSCAWTFGIYTGSGNATACAYVTTETATANASSAAGGPTVCGNYTVTSSWSGQFGAGQGFTTLAVVEEADRLIAYPAYTDAQLKNATVVTPDLSFPVQTLP